MLNPDVKIALDSVYQRASRLAAAYEHASELVDDDELSELLAELARSREAVADAVGRQARRIDAPDEAPNEPDPDRIDFERAARWLKMRVVGDEVSLVEARIDDENALAQSIEGVLDHELPEVTREAASRWCRTVEEARAALRDARETHGAR